MGRRIDLLVFVGRVDWWGESPGSVRDEFERKRYYFRNYDTIGCGMITMQNVGLT